MNNKLFEYFDHEKYLTARGVDWKASGENIGKNWVGIYECPYCGKPKYHFGMHKKDKKVSCWVCSTTKPLVSYIMKTERCDYDAAKKIIIQFSSDVIYDIIDASFSSHCKLPKTEEKISKRYINYLENRGLPGKKIIEKYQLKTTGIDGKLKHKIIFPFFLNGELITFLSRGLKTKGYRNCPIENSILDPKSTLYNIDTVNQGDSMLVAEGCFDVIKIGDKAVHTSGTEWTSLQVRMILNKRPKKVFVCFDSEFYAQKKAVELCNELAYFKFIDHVENINLSEGDLGDLSLEDASYLKKEIGLGGKFL